jgi:hypothetical protein
MMKKAEPLTFRNLLRDRHDRPVPYVNIWSAEADESTWRLMPDVATNRPGLAVPPFLRGEGDPDFKRQAPNRQRACMFRQLCQICTGRGDWILVSSISTKFVFSEDEQHLVMTEPWLCRPCADYALSTCPGLLGHQRKESMELVRPTSWRYGYSTGWVEGRLEEATKRVPCVMWGELYVDKCVDVNGLPVVLRADQVFAGAEVDVLPYSGSLEGS